MHFAGIVNLLAFATLPFPAQDEPISAELAFRNKVCQPCCLTDEPWTEMQKFTLKPPAATPADIRTTAGNSPWLDPLLGSRFGSSNFEAN
jgi:hypothetical protein